MGDGLTIINRHPDAGWEDRPTFYVETRSRITQREQRKYPGDNKKRFAHRIGQLREVYDRTLGKNKWVWPVTEGEEIHPEDDETYIVVAGSEMSQGELQDMVADMRKDAAQRARARQPQRPTPAQVNNALKELAAQRLRMGRHISQFVVPTGGEARAMADVAKTGLGMR